MGPRNRHEDYVEDFIENGLDADCWDDEEPAPSRFYEMYA